MSFCNLGQAVFGKCFFMCARSFKGTIEMQFLKLLRALRIFSNSPVPMTDSDNFVLRCSNYILNIKIRLQHAYSAEHNASIIT